MDQNRFTSLQVVALVSLRILIGWHFAYEGLYKLLLPGWTRDGARAAAWTARGYLQSSTGPFAPLFHRLGDTMLAQIDTLLPAALLLVGLSLMLGLFTRAGCLGAIAFLTVFYLSMPPTSGMPQPGAEGAYLLVNKNVIELAAVFVLLVFPTGRMAGLDRLVFQRRHRVMSEEIPFTVQE